MHKVVFNVAQEQMAVTTGTAGRQRSMSQAALQAFTCKLRDLDHIARATESSRFREVFQHHDTANKRHLRKLLKLSPEIPDSRCVDILRRPQSAGGGNAALTLDIADQAYVSTIAVFCGGNYPVGKDPGGSTFSREAPLC